MARNLQAKLPPSDTIRIFDLNKEAAKKLAQEMNTSQTDGATIEIARSVNEAAKDSVCSALPIFKSFRQMTTLSCI